MTYFAVADSDVRSLVSEAEHLLTAGNHKDHWLAMLDTAFDHDRRAFSWSKPSARLYRMGRLEALASFSPLLCHLSTHNSSELEKDLIGLIHHASGRPMLSFLRSEHSAHDLAQRLQSLLEIHTTDGQAFVLRLADTRVAPAIAVAFLFEHWVHLTRDIDRWIIVNRRGQLESLKLHGHLQPTTAVGATITLSDPELDELIKFGEADALTQSLFEGFPELLPKLHRAGFHETLSDVCVFARRHRITAFPELVSLGVATVATSGKILIHPGLAPWLEARTWARGQFEDGLTEFMKTAE